MTSFGLCGLLTTLLTWATVWVGPDRITLHISLWLLAGLAWLASVILPRPIPVSRRSLALLFSLALLLRLPLMGAAPRHSDDVYRYLWDGAVQVAGGNPYAAPPDGVLPAYEAARRAQPEVFSRINHRHLPTVYPPAAQVAFAGAALSARLLPGPSSLARALRGWKLLVLGCDLLVLAVLCRRTRDVRLAAIWGLSPLCAIELAQSGHMDVLGILPLCALLCLWPHRPFTSGLLMGVALLCKPLAAALAPGMWQRRSIRLGLGLITALLLGLLLYARPGVSVLGSLGEYGRRWRGNDGAHALIYEGCLHLTRAVYPPAYYDLPWPGPLAKLPPIITGRPRHSVWPDELAAFLSRLVVLGMLGVCLLRVRRWPIERAALALILSYLLLTPILHPWYALWGLCLCPMWPRAAGPPLVLALLCPLFYLPLPGYLTTGIWTPSWWPPVLVHGATLALLGLCLLRRSKQDEDLVP